MNGLNNLMSLMAFLSSTEELVQQLHSHCTNYLSTINEEEKKSEFDEISIYSSLILEKNMLGDNKDPKEFLNHVEELESATKAIKLIHPKEN